MKTRTTLRNAVVAMVFALGVGSAQAGFMVTFDTTDTTQATGILNLLVDGTFYNVSFTPNQQTAADVYGPFPGTFDFTTNEAAAAAADAVNDALNTSVAVQVGAEGSLGLNGYRIAFETSPDPSTVTFWDTGFLASSWTRASMPDGDGYNLGGRVWATFAVVPAPGAAWLLAPAIAALGGRRRRRTA